MENFVFCGVNLPFCRAPLLLLVVWIPDIPFLRNLIQKKYLVMFKNISLFLHSKIRLISETLIFKILILTMHSHFSFRKIVAKV